MFVPMHSKNRVVANVILPNARFPPPPNHLPNNVCVCVCVFSGVSSKEAPAVSYVCFSFFFFFGGGPSK